MKRHFFISLLNLALFVFLCYYSEIYPQFSITGRPYRISLQVKNGNSLCINKPIEYRVNFTEYLHSFNINKVFDDNSIKVIETDSMSSPTDTVLVFQFDKDADYDAQNNASGLLIFIMKGTTNLNTTRYFQVYFDAMGKQYPLPQFSSPLSILDNVMWAGQPSFKVTADNGVQYFFQKQGAGFASIIDKGGKDWVAYNTNTANTKYRGIPNMGACGHPGYPLAGDTSTLGSVSTIVSTGPLKIKIHSITTDNNWEFTWEFFPDFARMTLLKKGGNYWFLYEGVPNGSMDLESGYSVRNTHLRVPLSTSWTTGVLPSPKWAYFGDNMTQRVLFLAMHEQDSHNDFYRPYLTTQSPENMTVFGFGRQDPVQPNGKMLTTVPAHFTIGFIDDTTFSNVSKNILSDMSVLKISKTYDTPFQPIPLAPVLISPVNNSSGLSAEVKFSWGKPTGADSYQLQVSNNSLFTSAIFDSSGIKDTSIQLNIFKDGTKYYWRVSALNSFGKSSYSPVYSFITSLNRPDKLQAKYIPPARIQLNWVINSNTAPGYIVERKAGEGVYKIIDTTKPNEATYTDTSSSPGIQYFYRVKAFNQYTVSAYSNEVKISYLTSIENEVRNITEYSLEQNYPNPFNPSTIINYSLPRQSFVELKIYDLLGREVITLINQEQSAGKYKVNFSSSTLSVGIYIYTIKAGGFRESKKLIYLK